MADSPANSHRTDAGRRQVRLIAGFAIVVLVVLAGVTAAIVGLPAGFDLSGEAIAHYVESLGMWGHAAIIGLMVVHSFVPFPAEFVAAGAGMCYGAAWGTALTWTGAMIGATLSFGLTRWLGRSFAEAMLPERHRARLDAWTADQGAATLLASRFIPLIAFNLINYAAGLTRVSWWTFLWTTGLGILPLTYIMVLMGEKMTEISLPVLAGLDLTGCAIMAAAHLWLRRRRAATAPADRR
jgi:uncharacterized membrane protein YdjX (TVP38/TMEM64 family)